MKIAIQSFKVLFIFLLLYSAIVVFSHPHSELYNKEDVYIYSRGNASDSVRSLIIEQLQKFQDGYTERDTSQVTLFMEQLFSQNDILILGTMPREIYIGYDRASKLILSDWESWGDCTFLIKNAHISTSGNVAWISTIGYDNSIYPAS